MLCATSGFQHAGTTDVDVQVDLEIACGAVNTVRLEQALLNAEFQPGGEYAWRWKADGDLPGVMVKFELLADLAHQPANASITFDDCDDLGAANLRGTGFASRDINTRTLRARDGGVVQAVEVNVAGLGGFLLAKSAAARERRKTKDWYDIAFVLLHNDEGGAQAAVDAVRSRFSADLPAVSTTLKDLQANFSDQSAQGPVAYASQFGDDHPGQDQRTLRADAVLAVSLFCSSLIEADRTAAREHAPFSG